MPENPGGGGLRIALRILLLAFLFPFLSSVLRIPFNQFLLIPLLRSEGAAATGLWVTVIALLSFLISPVLLFVVLFFQEKRFRLKDEYRSIILSLFLGGFLSVLALYVLLFTSAFLAGQSFTSVPSVLTFNQLLAVLLVVVVYFSYPVESGLSVVFVGLSAFALAYLRRPEPTPLQSPVPKEGEPEAEPGRSI